MNRIYKVFLLLISTFLTSLCQTTLLYHQDTLNILTRFGREISVNEQNQFVIDSIIPGDFSYPCTIEHKGIFFASLSSFFLCPCCPFSTIGSSRTFYGSKSYNVNWSAPLKLNDTTMFTKFDTNKSTDGCELPRTGRNVFLIFTNITDYNKTTYLLVHVIKTYLDPSKPTQEGGGDLGYPKRTCDNMLVVRMWLQTDGTTNFRDAGLTSTLSYPKTSSINSVARSQKKNCKWYTLQGNVVTNLKSQNMPQGCYLMKSGSSLKKQVFLYPY